MCIAPNKLSNGVLVSCHECWQCREAAINDWVGRNIAESKTSVACHAATLTYGRNAASDVLHERSVVLTYSDVQKYLKLLRRHGYPVRYFITGEYGSLKGRAHWHCMFYWQDKVPAHQIDRSFHHEYWPHGHMKWTAPNHPAIRYNCKYVYKDIKAGDQVRQGHLAMSKKPPLGAEYFARLARRYVEAGIAPQALSDHLTAFGYSFGEVLDRGGAPIKFALRGKSLERFINEFLTGWLARWPGQQLPNSRLLDEALDPGAWRDVQPAVSWRLDYMTRAKPQQRWRLLSQRQWNEQFESDWERFHNVKK